MLDPAEVDRFNEWKATKLAGSVDLSIEAYNAEISKLSTAWKAGALAFINPGDHQVLSHYNDRNPYEHGGPVSETTRRITS